MKKAVVIAIVGLACLFAVSAADRKQGLPQDAPGAVQIAPSSSVKLEAGFGRMPLYFVANRGQMDERVDYYVQGRDRSIYFSPGGLTFVLASKKEFKQKRSGNEPLAKN